MVDKKSIDNEANKAWWIDYDIGDVINPRGSKFSKFDSEKVKEEKQASKELVIFLIILVSIYIGVIIFLFFRSLPPVIPENQLSGGILINLGKTDEVRFILDEESHKIKVEELGKKSINITITSEPVIQGFNKGEIKKFDFNNDSVYDLKVELRDIVNKKANIFVKKIVEVICFENWTCSEWGYCKDSVQTRTCEDLNDCGVIETKPLEAKECQSFLMNCSGSTNINIDCFIYFAETCKPSKLTYKFTINTLGWVQNNTHYYEIFGFTSGKCEIYQKIVSAFGKYSSAKRQSLLNEGNTDEEINKSELDRNAGLKNFTGKTGVCRYSTYYLTNMLKELKEFGVNLPVENHEDYQCTGSLYGDNETVWPANSS